jgi:hypothetical protein
MTVMFLQGMSMCFKRMGRVHFATEPYPMIKTLFLNFIFSIYVKKYTTYSCRNKKILIYAGDEDIMGGAWKQFLGT